MREGPGLPLRTERLLLPGHREAGHAPPGPRARYCGADMLKFAVTSGERELTPSRQDG